jgi:hypothetical protein
MDFTFGGNKSLTDGLQIFTVMPPGWWSRLMALSTSGDEHMMPNGIVYWRIVG